jgi:hypothetical protein
MLARAVYGKTASLGFEPRKRLRSRGFDSCDAALPRETATCVYVAASLGFEPRQRDPESLVLPLHHEATREKIKTDISRCKSSAAALVRDLIAIKTAHRAVATDRKSSGVQI